MTGPARPRARAACAARRAARAAPTARTARRAAPTARAAAGSAALTLLAAGLVALALPGTSAPAAAATPTDTLAAGHCLASGSGLTSAGGQFHLDVQGDGNVVQYGNGRALWWTGTDGVGAVRLCAQTDGNLVLSTAAGVPVWWTRTDGRPPADLVLQADDNLVLYAGGQAVWADGQPGIDTAVPTTTLTGGQLLRSRDGRFQLVAQADGNLVLYAGSTPLWFTGTRGGATRTVLQADGNLVVYDVAGRPLWWSRTDGAGAGVVLVLQDDGNLVLYGPGGVPLWDTGTVHLAAPLGYHGPAHQLITVAAPSAASTSAVVTGWTLTPTGWVVAQPSTAGLVGGAGIGAAAEGSSRTPAGTFTLTQAFGRQADPGTALPYLRTDTQDWWDENPASPTYNLHVRRTSSPGGASENLYLAGPVYDYAVVIDYNTARVPGAGSAIFLHVSDGTPTAGCVSVPRDREIALLRWLDPSQSPAITIGVG